MDAGCQRAIINVSFSSNSQQVVVIFLLRFGCQRAIINVSFSSNSQPVVGSHVTNGAEDAAHIVGQTGAHPVDHG